MLLFVCPSVLFHILTVLPSWWINVVSSIPNPRIKNGPRLPVFNNKLYYIYSEYVKKIYISIWSAEKKTNNRIKYSLEFACDYRSRCRRNSRWTAWSGWLASSCEHDRNDVRLAWLRFYLIRQAAAHFVVCRDSHPHSVDFDSAANFVDTGAGSDRRRRNRNAGS